MADFADRSLLSQEVVSRADGYRRQRHTSMLTILFADIVGFTTVCERATEPEVVEGLLVLRGTAERTIETEHGGTILKWIGDALLAVFADPVSAVRAAVGLNQKVASISVAEKHGLQLRMGIHTGIVAVDREEFGRDVFGRHVNRAARVQSAAAPGQFLVTDVVEDNVWTWGLAESAFVFSPGRQLNLIDIERPVQVHAVESVEAVGEARRRVCEELRKALTHPGAIVRKRALLRIAAGRVTELTNECSERIANDEDSEVRDFAVWAADQLQDATSIASFITALNDRSEEVRSKAQWALVHLSRKHPSEVRSALRQLNDSNSRTRAQGVLDRLSENRRVEVCARATNAVGTPGDVLVVKFARELSGIDNVVVAHLLARGVDVRSSLPAPGEHYYCDANLGAIVAKAILFVGLPELESLDYADLQDYVRRGLQQLAVHAPITRTMLLTHPMPQQFSRKETAEHLVSGISQALRDGNHPTDLERMILLNRNEVLVQTMARAIKRVLGQ